MLPARLPHITTPDKGNTNCYTNKHPVVTVKMRSKRKFLDQILLHDYIFEWGSEKRQCCMVRGYMPVYNYSYKGNCEYKKPARLNHSGRDFDNERMIIKTVQAIKAGEELFINYNGDWNNNKPV